MTINLFLQLSLLGLWIMKDDRRVRKTQVIMCIFKIDHQSLQNASVVFYAKMFQHFFMISNVGVLP